MKVNLRMNFLPPEKQHSSKSMPLNFAAAYDLCLWRLGTTNSVHFFSFSMFHLSGSGEAETNDGRNK